MDFGILIARIVLGVLMAGHGAQKLFGWFGGGGIQGTTDITLARSPQRNRDEPPTSA